MPDKIKWGRKKEENNNKKEANTFMQTTYSPWTDAAPHKQATPKYVVRAQWAGAYHSCKPAPWRQAPSPRQGWMRSPGAAKAPPEQMPSTSSGKAAPNKGTGTDNKHSGRRGSAGPKPQKSWNSSLRNLNNLVVQLKSLIWERRERKQTFTADFSLNHGEHFIKCFLN